MDIQLSISVSPSPPRVLQSPSPQPINQPIDQPADQPAQEPSPSSMPLPPEAIYNSKEELYTSIQAWAAQHLYAFSIGRSKKIARGDRIKIVYNCDRYGPPPPENHSKHTLQARKQHTTTRKTGCQFSIVAIQRSTTEWELRHRPGVEYSIHNHSPSQSISSHPAHRKLVQGELNQAKALHNAG